MQLNLGMGLKWQGRNMICTRITEIKEDRFAHCSSEEWKAQEARITNQRIMHSEFDEFAEGDMVSVERQTVELTEFGKHIFHLVPYLKVKKESKADGRQGPEQSVGQATDGSPQGGEEGTQSGSSDGEQSTSQDSSPAD